MTTIFGGLVFYITTNLQAEFRSREEFQLKKLLTEKAKIVYDLILDDKDNDSDSLLDEAWLYAEQNEDVSLRDISSYINPNWVDSEILTHLNGALLPDSETLFIMEGRTLDDILNNENDGFINYREKHGVLPDIKHAYSKYFSEENIERFFTEYNYFNINIAAISPQRKLYEARSGSTGEAENFYNQIIAYFTALNAQFKPGGVTTDMITSSTLEHWFLTKGPGQAGYNLMFPVYNAEPVMNINHVPEEILYAILSFPAFKVSDPEAAVEKAVKMREQEAINKGVLWEILGYEKTMTYPGKKLYQFFGATTWFWEIKAFDGDAELTWIIARIPPPTAGTVITEFKLIKEEFRINKKKVVPEDDDTLTEDEDINNDEDEGNDPPAEEDTGGE